MNEKMMKEMTPQELEDFHKSFHDSADKWEDTKIEILSGMYSNLGLERINELTQEDLEWEIEKYARMKKYIGRKERLDPFDKSDIAILLQNKEYQPLPIGMMKRVDIICMLWEASGERVRRAKEKTRLAKEERMRNDPECAKRGGWW